jgi:hypothetical protein
MTMKMWKNYNVEDGTKLENLKIAQCFEIKNMNILFCVIGYTKTGVRVRTGENPKLITMPKDMCVKPVVGYINGIHF